MVDNFNKKIRSKIMSSIRSTHTKPELILKKALGGLGFVYQPKLKGSPDFIHRKKRIAIFVQGCFWHKCPMHYKEPKSRKEYWVPKIKRNAERDAENAQILKEKNYNVLLFWEHDIMKNLESCANKIRKKLE